MNNRIKELRRAQGISQGELAEVAKCRRETIANLESGKYNPSVDLAYRISKRLGVTIEELFEFEEDE